MKAKARRIFLSSCRRPVVVNIVVLQADTKVFIFVLKTKVGGRRKRQRQKAGAKGGSGRSKQKAKAKGQSKGRKGRKLGRGSDRMLNA